MTIEVSRCVEMGAKVITSTVKVEFEPDFVQAVGGDLAQLQERIGVLLAQVNEDTAERHAPQVAVAV